MKFTCEQSAIATELSIVLKAVPTRPSKPILISVLIKASEADQIVEICGFNEEISIKTKVNAAVELSGVAAVPAKNLSDLVNLLPDEPLTFEAEDNVFKVDSSSGSHSLMAFDASDYPDLPASKDLELLGSFRCEQLLDCIQTVAYAQSPDKTRTVLNGIRFDPSENNWSFAATDGHRLAVTQVEWDFLGEEPQGFTLPRKSTETLIPMLKALSSSKTTDIESLAGISGNEFLVEFDLGSRTLISRLIDGQYPDYRRIVPKEFNYLLDVDPKDLAQAVSRVTVCGNVERVDIEIKKDSLSLGLNLDSVGDFSEEVEASSTGEMELRLNSTYFVQALKAVDSGSVQIRLNTPTSPIVVAPVGGEKTTHLIMPIQKRSV